MSTFLRVITLCLLATLWHVQVFAEQVEANTVAQEQSAATTKQKSVQSDPLTALNWQVQNSDFRLGTLLTTSSVPDLTLTDSKFDTHYVELAQAANSSASFTNGRFYAESGFYASDSDNDQPKFYLQSSFIVFNHTKLNVAVTARVETKSNADNFYQIDNARNYIANDMAHNATLGIVGTYAVSKQWTLIGAMTATTFDNDTNTNQNTSNDYRNMALIGASYSF